MSVPSASQSASAFQTNECNTKARPDENPGTSFAWEHHVRKSLGSGGSPARIQLEPELDRSPHHIRLCGLRRWKAGKDDAKGSGLHFEHFLHFRALIRQHEPEEFPLRNLVKAKYAEAADLFLRSWQEFDNYIMQVPSSDPATEVDSLGLFAGAKLVQNQVLLDAYLGTSQDGADSFQDSISETPLKKTKRGIDLNTTRGIDFNTKPPTHDAADEQVVNQALISFASALTRRWMVQQTSATVYPPDQTPSKGASAAPAHDWKTVADWTMARDRFHIRERMRKGDLIQEGHLEGLQASRRKDNLEVLADGHSYGRVLTSETDGSLYSIGAASTEVLAIVEAKKRLRAKNQLKIEWQEAAEMLAWLNARLRMESAGKGKGLMTERRGMLEPKPAVGRSQEKSRCLLVAQDREEIYLVIGEWDALYEEYALDGKFSDANIKMLKELKAKKDPASIDAGFLTLHVYGPFGGFKTGLSSRGAAMRKLGANLLALSLHLSQASCSPSSRRISPAGSIQLPAPRGTGRPCCAGCTCDCRCGKTPSGTPGASRSQSESSETRRGKREDSRGGSRPREPSTKSTASRPSQDSGRQDTTPTRDQRSSSKRPDEGRAASIRDQSVPRPVQAQAHDNLPLRGRRAAADPQGSSSEARTQPGRSKSRGRDSAATGQHGQPPGTAATLPRPPPLPQAAGAPGPVPGQQQQYQSQRPPRRQAAQGMQPRRDPQYAPESSGTQQHGAATSTQTHQHIPRPQVPGQMAGTVHQPTQDPFHGPGPSYQTQAGPSSFSTPAGAAVPPDARDPSQPQRQPDETPVKKKKKDKKNTPIKDIFSFGKKKDKNDKK